jgi:hypothetical protein
MRGRERDQSACEEAASAARWCGSIAVHRAVARVEVVSAGCGGTQQREHVGHGARERDALPVAAVPRQGEA